MQVDDDGFGGQRGTVPLHVALSLGVTFLATLAAIAVVTFQHVESSAPYVVAIRAPGPAAPRPAKPAPTVAAAPSRTRRHRIRHAPPAAKVRASAVPRTPTALSADVTARPLSLAAGRRHASRAHRRIAAGPPDGPSSDVAAAPVILTATAEDAVAPAAPAVTRPPEAAGPAPVVVSSPAPTEAAVAAVPAPVYAPSRVVEARVKLAAEPDFPADPGLAGLHGTSAVLVTIGPEGGVVKVALERSSGHEAFDQAALSAARRSLYAAPEIDGKPATASYRMVYEFGQ